MCVCMHCLFQSTRYMNTFDMKLSYVTGYRSVRIKISEVSKFNFNFMFRMLVKKMLRFVYKRCFT